MLSRVRDFMRKKVNALSDLSHESLITMNGLHKVDLISTIAMSMI